MDEPEGCFCSWLSSEYRRPWTVGINPCISGRPGGTDKPLFINVMELFDLSSAIKKRESVRKNTLNNGEVGAYVSGGSMRNPMYRNIACEGFYIPTSSRVARRAHERAERQEAKARQSGNKSVSKFHKGFA